MLGLRKELTPAEEARKQREIEEEYRRQHADRLEADRQLNVSNARRRQQIWEQQAQDAEDRRMAELAGETQERQDRAERQHQADVARNAELVAGMRRCEEECRNIARAIGELSDNAPDLSSPAACIAAAERQAKVAALRELAEQADVRLLAAERLCGRHRR